MCEHIYIYIYKGWLKSSYDDVISTVDFLTMESKYSITYGRSRRTTRGIMMKNKPHLVTYYKSILVSHVKRSIGIHMAEQKQGD